MAPCFFPIVYLCFAALILLLVLASLVDLIFMARRSKDIQLRAFQCVWVYVVGIVAGLVFNGVFPDLVQRYGRVGCFYIAGDSMRPNFSMGNTVLVDRRASAIREANMGDVVVYHTAFGVFVKRLMARAGDEIYFQAGVPIVNGVALPQEALSDVPEAQPGLAGASVVVRETNVRGQSYLVWATQDGGITTFPLRRIPDRQGLFEFAIYECKIDQIAKWRVFAGKSTHAL